MEEADPTGPFEGGGDSVILWQLVGESDTDGDGVGDTTVSVVPNDRSEDDRGSTIRYDAVNTEIYEELINDESYYNFEVLEVTNGSSAPFDDIYNTCMGDSDGDGTTDVTLTELSLQLNIVTKLFTTSGAIPYLEWQLITDSYDPPGDNKAVIIGEGYHQGAKGIFSSKFVWTRSTTGESTNIYTLSN